MSEAPTAPLEASASGKVVLFGEYAVLEGAEALVYASERQVLARLLSPLDDPAPHVRRYTLTSPALGFGSWEGELPGDRGLSARLQAEGRAAGVRFDFAWATLRALDAPSGAYWVDSSALGIWGEGPDGVPVWRKLGLGSSAASVSALVELCAQLKSAPISASRRYQLTQLIHRHVQGALGSGVDAVASAYGGLLRYRWHLGRPLTELSPSPGWERLEVKAGEELIGTADVSPLQRPLPALAWVWMGRSASTTSLVTQVKALRAQQPKRYQALMCSIERASLLASDALSSTDAALRQRAFCEAVEAGGHATRQLTEASGAPVWTEEHSALRSLIQPLGASLKPTGAGGGDLSLVCAPTLESHQELLARCISSGWELIQL